MGMAVAILLLLLTSRRSPVFPTETARSGGMGLCEEFSFFFFSKRGTFGWVSLFFLSSLLSEGDALEFEFSAGFEESKFLLSEFLFVFLGSAFFLWGSHGSLVLSFVMADVHWAGAFFKGSLRHTRKSSVSAGSRSGSRVDVDGNCVGQVNGTGTGDFVDGLHFLVVVDRSIGLSFV
jgi:hypothetical protein